MKTLYCFLCLAAMAGMMGCSPSAVRGAYLSPMGTCGYTVFVGATDTFGPNVKFSKCMSFDQAKALADKINQDMDGKWSWENSQ